MLYARHAKFVADVVATILLITGCIFGVVRNPPRLWHSRERHNSMLVRSSVGGLGGVPAGGDDATCRPTKATGQYSPIEVLTCS